MWRGGWLTETYAKTPHNVKDLGLRHVALTRRKLRMDADWLARLSVGRTVADLESDGVGRNRLRFVRGDHQPRPLDGIVHAWLDADDRVVRTQFS